MCVDTTLLSCTVPENPAWDYWYYNWDTWQNDVQGYWKKKGIGLEEKGNMFLDLSRIFHITCFI